MCLERMGGNLGEGKKLTRLAIWEPAFINGLRSGEVAGFVVISMATISPSKYPKASHTANRAQDYSRCKCFLTPHTFLHGYL